jgi:hypothetical protein
VVNFADQWERDKALGVSGAYVPPELLADADVTLLDAAEAMQLLQSNSVQSNQVTELMPPAPPEVLVSAEASVEEAGGQGCRGARGKKYPWRTCLRLHRKSLQPLSGKRT